MELPEGGRIVIQMHYNLRSEQGVDNTAVRLRVSDKKLKPCGPCAAGARGVAVRAGETGRLCDRTDAVDDVGEPVRCGQWGDHCRTAVVVRRRSG